MVKISRLSSVTRIITFSFMNHFKFVITERLFFINAIITPLGLSILFYFIYANNGPNEIALGVVKAGLLGLWGANIWGASFILQGEKRLGTLDYLMVSPKSIYLVLIGKSVAVVIASNISVIISFVWIQIFVGSIWEFFDLVQVIVIILASSFSFSCIGLMVGVFFINFRQPEILVQFLTYPIYIISGIAVQIELFPILIQFISKTVPLYWSQRGLFEIINNKMSITTVIFLLMIGVINLIIGSLILKKVERRARWTGDFSKY